MAPATYAGQYRERQAERLSNRTGRRPTTAALSTVLAQQPASFDGKKIAAVDKSIASLDALPERYAAVKTLYISKNSLTSLAGIEQFRGLRALSAADNALADLDCLRLLPAAGIALEAASFEGNPMADLPNYRAHVLATLGPSLAMLDNRLVSDDERRAAAGAVAHEATMLALMTSNACLVHKLGRAVQLVKLHCELQCAVLGGQYGSTGSAGPEGLPGTSGRGITRVLQLWDYEGSLGRQERHAIGLAIRREVGRRYRKLVLGGGKPEGSSKLWQQAFAQVMLLQQETIAGLMGMLEEAKREAATTLAPITRPPSPRKRQALEGEREAAGRVQQDREALIQELRDAFLGLADAAAHTNAPQQAAHFEARIRELHAALEAAGDSGLVSRQAVKPRDGNQPVAAGQWAIAAVRPGSGGPGAASPAAARGQQGTGNKNALKQLAPRPASACPQLTVGSGGSSAASGSASASRQQQQRLEHGQRQMQVDDGLAEYERMEQARCRTPRPFQGRDEVRQSARHAAASASGQASPARESSRHLHPASPTRSLPGSPSTQWTPNPLAHHGNEGDASPRAESPRQGLRSLFQLLQREGRLNQMQALQEVVAQHETTAAELQASNHQLAVALQEVQQHTKTLEAQLADQRAALEEAQAAVAAQDQQRVKHLQELGGQLEAVLASRAALRAELEQSAADHQRLVEQTAAERQRLVEQAQLEREAMASQTQQLVARVVELEGRKAVDLCLTVVSHEAEWRAEASRAALLEARAGDLAGRVAAYEQHEHQEAACCALACRVILRQALARWRDTAAECAHLKAMKQQAASLHRHKLLAAWLSTWQLAVQRSKVLEAREQQRHLRHLQHAWEQWRVHCQDGVLRRGLGAAATMHRQGALLRQCFAAWAQQAAACQQVELPPQHPAMRAAAELQHRRLLRSVFCAWRQYMQEHVLPRMAQVQVRLLELWMGSQRRALVAWQQYLAHRRQARLLKALADGHHLRQRLVTWRDAAAEAKQERTAALRGALTSQTLLLRRAWRAWRLGLHERRHRAEQRLLAHRYRHQKLLVACWQGWREWALLCRGMAQRNAARLLAVTLKGWRGAVKAAEKRRLADAFLQHCRHRRFRASLCGWQAMVALKRCRQHQLVHARSLLHRHLLCRVVACWRRAALAGKLCATLGAMAQLQNAVERVRQELKSKAEQVDTLQSVRVEVEVQSECLSLQVDNLDADLAAVQRQAAELQEMADAAQQQHQEAAEALEQALAARAAAERDSAVALAQRDAAVAGREQAEAERAAAFAAREEAERAAADASSRAEAAAAAAATAVAQATTASAALEQLLLEHQQAQEQLRQAQEERWALATDLEKALAEVQRTAGVLEGLQEECNRLQREGEVAEQGSAAAAEEQQAALKQAARLAALCEEQEQRCGQLQQQVAQLQGLLASQRALQEELCALGDRNRQLQADNQSMQAQLDRFAAAVQEAQGDRAGLQQAADELHSEQLRLHARAQEAEAEARQLAKLADSLQGAKTALEGQLVEARAEASQAAAQQDQAAAAAGALRCERDSLASTVKQLEEEKTDLEAAVSRLQKQLQQSNTVLDSCRQMLGECCSARATADDQEVSLTELLRSLKAEQLLKEASIKTLTRENVQRGERLRALQAQVEALSQQEAAAPQSYCFPVLGASSPAASYISLTAPQQQAAGSTSIGKASPGSAGSGGSSTTASAAEPASIALAPLLPQYGLFTAPPPLAPELSEQRLSYLLQMVVAKEITSAHAQQVINAAAEGDARPLLQVLDGVRRRVEARGISMSPASGPLPEAELAAVRQQIQQHLRHQQRSGSLEYDSHPSPIVP